jgi:methyl-accepting chemotaxis protein
MSIRFRFNFFKKSLRYKILAPLTLILVVSFFGMAVTIIRVQDRLLTDMGSQVDASLGASSRAIINDFKIMDQSVNEKLQKMAEDAGTQLATSTGKALEAEKAQMHKAWEGALGESAASLASLLAQVAPAAILSNSFSDLISYVRSASNNPDIVYAMYFRPNGKPYTRYLNRKDPKIKGYLKTGTGKKKYEKVLSASKGDGSVFFVEKPVELEGKQLGKILLCISKASMNQKLDEMAARFSGLTETTEKDIKTVLAKESSKVTALISDVLSTVSAKNDTAIKRSIARIVESSKIAKARTMQLVSIFGGGLGAMLLLVIGFMVVRLVIKPIERVAAGLEDIAQGEGDLTTRLDVGSEDEIGRLAKWFNVFMEKLQGIIKDISLNAASLTGSAEELSSLSAQMSSGSEITSSKSSTVASAAEEMNANVTSIASTMEQASTNMGVVAASVEQMAASINEIAQNSEKASSTTSGAVSLAKSSSERVEGLGQAAKEISKVTGTITEISEQTNLLALNATIEAARAGEAGKGFAVVANEIKELARQTAEATDEIRERITGIQESISGTIADIEQVPKVINEVNEIVSTIATAVEEQSVTTREIANNVTQTSQGISEVNENVAQSSTVTKDIAKEISEVNHAAGDMTNSSSQVQISAKSLSELATKLNEMVGTFRV